MGKNHPHLSPLPAYAEALAGRPSMARKKREILGQILKLDNSKEKLGTGTFFSQTFSPPPHS
jgi:hypothetical protein